MPRVRNLNTGGGFGQELEFQPGIHAGVVVGDVDAHDELVVEEWTLQPVGIRFFHPTERSDVEDDLLDDRKSFSVPFPNDVAHLGVVHISIVDGHPLVQQPRIPTDKVFVFVLFYLSHNRLACNRVHNYFHSVTAFHVIIAQAALRFSDLRVQDDEIVVFILLAEEILHHHTVFIDVGQLENGFAVLIRAVAQVLHQHVQRGVGVNQLIADSFVLVMHSEIKIFVFHFSLIFGEFIG